ncbi:TatD family hydrolase [Amnibacterium endophyticum]|uniref:TatD family hydrolase n=1 Tax=Amnibacterium endophyticum TaxID=2109337 RepID=A0ABW4LID3_9MICO
MPDVSYPPLPERLPVPVYDDHTHIDPYSAAGWFDEGEPLDWREQLDRAEAAGVQGVVQVGTDVESSRWSAETAAVEPRMLAAVAIHPNDAARMTDAELDEALAVIDDLAARPRVRAVGETGLDFFRTAEDGRAQQLAAFEAHIAIAKRHGLALQIHDRDAHDDVVATLLRVGAPERTVFHCFSGGPELARTAAEHGWYCSFAGTVTFKSATRLREALALVPRDRILVETDAPWLAPTPVRGRPNSPYLVPHTLRLVAQELGVDVGELGAQVAASTEAVYGSWSTDLP